MTGKSTPSLLRAVYLRCVLALSQPEDSAHTAIFSPLVKQSLERVFSSSSPQPAALEEALVACHVLISISRPKGVPAEVWGVAGSHCEQLVSNKLITTATQDSESTCVYIILLHGRKYGMYIFICRDESLNVSRQRINTFLNF